MTTRQVRTLPAARAALAAAGAGVAYGLAEPGFGFWPLAPVCLVPLLRSLCGRSPGARAALGWLAGTLMTLVATGKPALVGAAAYWEVGTWQAIAISLAVGQVFGAGTFAVFCWLAGDPVLRHPAVSALRAGAALAAAEWLRSTLFTGLPWALLAHTLSPVPLLAQSAALAGALFVSAWLAAANAGVLFLLLPGRRRAGAAVLGAIGSAVAIGAATAPAPTESGTAPAPGSVAIASERTAESDGSLRVVLVQGDVPTAWRADRVSVTEALGRLIEITRAGGPADLVVWPENAVSFLLPVNEGLIGSALARLESPTPFLLLGSPWSDSAGPHRLANAAVLFEPGGRLRGRHDKVHLLPFAEYVPWPFGALGVEGPRAEAGERPVPLHVDGAVLGPLICYEIVFPEIARALVLDGAGVLVNISNDAWFGDTGAVEQHFAAAVFRAIETRRPLLRATNTGVTAAIDAAGRVVARLPRNRPASLTVAVVPAEELTLYVRWGDFAAWLALLASAAGIVADATTRRSRAS